MKRERISQNQNISQNRNLHILEAVLAVLVLIFVGFSLQQRSAEEKEEEEVIHLVDIDNVTSFGYEEGDSSMSYTIKDDAWTYDADPEIPLNQTVVGNAELSIQDLSAVRELEDPDPLEDYGLTDPAYHLWLSGGNEEAVIYIGNATEDNYYATVGDTGKVYTVASDILSYLPFEMDEIVQTDEVPTISSGNLVSVSVTSGGKMTEYTSQEDLDELAGGFGALTLDEVENYHASAEDLKKYGLDDESRITATATYTTTSSEEEDEGEEEGEEAGEEKTFTVYIGKKDKSKENRYVTVKGSDIVYLISSTVADNMITGSES